MPSRRNFLRTVAAAVPAAAAAGTVATGAPARGVEWAVGPPPELIGQEPLADAPPVIGPDPFLDWGRRIVAQTAECNETCTTVRYSAVEGIVVIRHAGKKLITLNDEHWYGNGAAGHESKAISQLNRQHERDFVKNRYNGLSDHEA